MNALIGKSNHPEGLMTYSSLKCGKDFAITE